MAWKRGKIERGIKAKFACNRLNSPWGSSPSTRPGSASAFSTWSKAVGQFWGPCPRCPSPAGSHPHAGDGKIKLNLETEGCGQSPHRLPASAPHKPGWDLWGYRTRSTSSSVCSLHDSERRGDLLLRGSCPKSSRQGLSTQRAASTAGLCQTAPPRVPCV